METEGSGNDRGGGSGGNNDSGGGGGGRGGIGGSGEGWSGSGNESRESAANAGADVGRNSGGGGRGGEGGGRGGGSNNNRGLNSPSGTNRRTSAVDSFRGISKSISNSLGGLTQGLADQLGEIAGVGQKESKSTLGEVGWQGSGSKSRAEAGYQDFNTGTGLAQDTQIGRTIASTFGLAPAVEVVGDVTAKSMTPDAQRAYEAAMGSRPTTATTAGGIAGKMAGIPGQPVNVGVELANTAAMDSFVNSFNPDSSARTSRRSSAVSAFSPGNSGARSSLAATTPSQSPNVSSWEPASYGFGDYGSHVKGLLG